MKALSLYSLSTFLVSTATTHRTRPLLFLFGATKIATQRSISSEDITTSSKKPTKNSEDSTKKTNTTATVSQAATTLQPRHDQVQKKIKAKTMAKMDEELRLKLEGISGEGGEAGLELEDGKPVAMKRGVKENMFRLI